MNAAWPAVYEFREYDSPAISLVLDCYRLLQGPKRSDLRGIVSFASHGIHDVSGEQSLSLRVTGGPCGLAFHPLPLETNALCIASYNSTTAFFLSMENSRFFRGQLEEPKVRDFADFPVRPCLVPGGRSS